MQSNIVYGVGHWNVYYPFVVIHTYPTVLWQVQGGNAAFSWTFLLTNHPHILLDLFPITVSTSALNSGEYFLNDFAGGHFGCRNGTIILTPCCVAVIHRAYPAYTPFLFFTVVDQPAMG